MSAPDSLQLNEANSSAYACLQHDKSILGLAASSTSIFAGTEGGEILVYDIRTLRRIACVIAHEDSILGLFLSPNEDLLFSAGADHTVNVWNAQTYVALYTVHSVHDIGDVFCVAYSAKLDTLYLGAQNASIQWYDLKEKFLPSQCSEHVTNVGRRREKFFGCAPPNRTASPVPSTPNSTPKNDCLQIKANYIHNFAHHGYVYAMLLVNDISSDHLQHREVLITGGGDGTIKIWGLYESGEQRIYEKYSLGTNDEEEIEQPSVLSLALDGNFLVSGHSNGLVNIWHLETRQLVRTLKTSLGDINAMSVGNDHLFLCGSTGRAERYDSQQYLKVEDFHAHAGNILASAYVNLEDNSQLITGASDNCIKVWNVPHKHSSLNTSVTSNEKLVDRLRAFVAHRTISSDSQYHTECQRGASFLRSTLREFGAQTELLVPENADLNPVVVGKFSSQKQPIGHSKRSARVLFYGHYDVIRAEKGEGEWRIDPFVMTGLDEHLYGRGTSDNKGPLLAAIYAVAELIAAKALECDVIFVVEGEEECGSRGFEPLIRKYKDLIGPVDWILLANSYWLDDRVPCLTYGLRGVIHANVEISSQNRDLHSGVEGSSLMDESLKDLVLLLNTLIGPKGKVNLPGFYDPVLPLTESEAVLYDYITQALRTVGATDDAELAKKLQKKWRESSMTIHRFNTSGPENSTIIPASAKAALSFRLVPNQEADQVAQDLVDYLTKQFTLLESNNTLRVTINRKAEPWLGDYNNDMYKTLEGGILRVWYGDAKAAVLSGDNADGSGDQEDEEDSDSDGRELQNLTLSASTRTRESRLSTSSHDALLTTMPYEKPPHKPLYIREGGSIPAIRFLEKEFGAPAAHLPCGQSSDNAHLDNERFRLINLYKSREIFKWVFSQLPGKQT